MTHTPHELHGELPELADRITELKTSDAHFARLAEEYHEINRADTKVEPVEDLAETEMRKTRACAGGSERAQNALGVKSQ